MNEIVPIRREDAESITGNVQMLGDYVGRLAVIIQSMQERIQMLEDERCVTIRHADAKGLAALIRDKAGSMAEKNNIHGTKGVNRIRGNIKKSVLKYYGISDFHDLPANALDGARRRIENYANIRLIMEIRRNENGSG